MRTKTKKVTLHFYHTKPVFRRTEVSPLIEYNIEDDHDTNHGVERDQRSHRRELSFVVDNHEDEEDENSVHKIHQHLQHQHQDVKRGQSLIFILVARLNNKLHGTWYNKIIMNLIFTMETVMVMKESKIEKVLYVTSCSRSKSSARNNFRISGRL